MPNTSTSRPCIRLASAPHKTYDMLPLSLSGLYDCRVKLHGYHGTGDLCLMVCLSIVRSSLARAVEGESDYGLRAGCCTVDRILKHDIIDWLIAKVP